MRNWHSSISALSRVRDTIQAPPLLKSSAMSALNSRESAPIFTISYSTGAPFCSHLTFTAVLRSPFGRIWPAIYPGSSPWRLASSSIRAIKSAPEMGDDSRGQIISRHTAPSGKPEAWASSTIMPALALPLPRGTATRRPACQKSSAKKSGRDHVRMDHGGDSSIIRAYML